MACNLAKFLRNADHRNAKEKDAIDYLTKGGNSKFKDYFTLTKFADQYLKMKQELDKDDTLKHKDRRKKRLNNKDAHKLITKAIKKQSGQPLRTLKRNKDSSRGKEGTFTTDEEEIDKIANEAWDVVYNGNTDDIDKTVNDFFIKYERHIPKMTEQRIKKLDWKDVKHALSKGLDSSGGL
jgi:hypothetical protein